MRVLTEAQIERFFNILNQASELIQKAKDQSYLDSLIETLSVVQDQDATNLELSDADTQKLTHICSGFNRSDYDSETLRKGIQMAILKATRVDNIQANYQITPDTIANVIGYIISGIFRGTDTISLLDPAMGTGNLLTALYNQLHNTLNLTPSISGIENRRCHV
ncbi:hypothetical protein [Lentilactobacillus kisonensis]|uniref:hypothetical protein n=1 Tax=Lentilactobacillus kisonensis TaxID=481722 RepID=UPI000317226B|nr:hypothetical protein [Lentilactobacillus kisonensis]